MQETENAIYMEPEEYAQYLQQMADNITSTAKIEGEIPLMSLYEMNQQMTNQLPAMDEKEVELKCAEELNSWWHEGNDNFEYYMLLCKELSYFTVFHLHWVDLTTRINFIESFTDIVKGLGGIKMIEPDNNGALSVWADWQNQGETHCFYLFPYDQGVVEV